MSDKTSEGMPTPADERLFADWRQELGEILDGFFSHRAPWSGSGTEALTPVIDIVEKADIILLTVELPGIDEKDIELAVGKGALLLKGEKKSEAIGEADSCHVAERRYGAFERTVRIPANVDEANISACFDKGVLTVTLPKKTGLASASRRIEIRRENAPGKAGAT